MKTEKRKRMEKNPFSTAYLLREIDFYGLKEPYSKDGVSVEFGKLMGIKPDYLNKRFRLLKRPIPILRIDGEIWMSITAMEVQSAALAIKRARGVVATAGLGMGYFAMRAANKKSVTRVDVYELDPRIIEFFNSTFKHRKFFHKINIIQGDVRELMVGKTYDFVFLDIYKSMLEEECIDDIQNFRTENDIGVLHVWGEERVMLDTMQEHKFFHYPVPDMRRYLKQWLRMKFKSGERWLTLSGLYECVTSEDYCERFLGVLCD